MTLPLVPSTNALTFNAKWGGRSKTQKYKDWIEAATPIVERMPAVTRFPVQIDITIRGTKGFSAASDIGNREKALTDLIVSLDKLPGDSRRYVKKITIEHVDDQPGPAADVLVRITPYKSNK